MERERVDAWIEAYRRAWEQADTPAAVALFTPDASYRSHPLRPTHAGSDGIAAYWSEVTADQRDPRVRFGDPIVDGDRVAVEWWTTMLAGGDPVSLAGCLLLAFAADGRCRDLRECWNLTEGLVDPPPDWGRFDPAAGGAREHARRWAEGYERAWRAADPEAAAALYAPDTSTGPSPSAIRTRAARAWPPTPAAPTPPRPTRTPGSAPRWPPPPPPRSSGGPRCWRSAGRPP
jgi:ketosteroid isomerase-like protein